ncbi:tyrosine-type recombinase/integrase, partial [Georgenia thermotolerans]
EIIGEGAPISCGCKDADVGVRCQVVAQTLVAAGGHPDLDEAMTGKGPDDLLFSGPTGGRLVAANFRRAVDWATIRPALARPDLRVHDLRHTFATILFDAGASAPDVQAVLGHSSLQVTERYSRAREGVARRAGAVFDSLTGGGGHGYGTAPRGARSVSAVSAAEPRRRAARPDFRT